MDFSLDTIILKRLRFVFLSLLAMVILPADSISKENGAPGYRVETDRLVLQWDDEPDSTEIEAVTAEATSSPGAPSRVGGSRRFNSILRPSESSHA